MKKELPTVSRIVKLDDFMTVRTTFKISDKTDQIIKKLKSSKTGVQIKDAFGIGLSIVESTGGPVVKEAKKDQKIRRTFVIQKNVLKRIDILAGKNKTDRNAIVSWIVDSFDSVIKAAKNEVVLDKLEAMKYGVDGTHTELLFQLEEIFGQDSEYYKTIDINFKEIYKTLEKVIQQLQDQKL